MGSVGKSLGSVVKSVNPVKLAGQVSGGLTGGIIGGDLGGKLGQAATPMVGTLPWAAPLGIGQEKQQALSPVEAASGITPPAYESYRSADGTGLKDQFKYDPTQSGAFTAQKDQAMSTAPSAWAQLQTQKQQLDQGSLLDQAAKSNLQGQSMAAGSLARLGGLGGGARTRMAMQGAKDLMMQKQGIAHQGIADRLGIATTDESNRQNLLKSVADTELAGQEKNLGLMTGDVTNKAQFDANRYNEQMRAWAANKSANAQVSAANSARGSKK